MTKVILYDPDKEHYHFDMTREWVGPRQYDVYAATVTCDRGRIEVIDEKLSHYVDGQHHKYDAAWLVENAAEPPDGLTVELQESN